MIKRIITTQIIGTCQCSELRVHPAPGVHHLAARCTHVGTCAPGDCTLIMSILYIL